MTRASMVQFGMLRRISGELAELSHRTKHGARGGKGSLKATLKRQAAKMARRSAKATIAEAFGDFR